MEHELRHVQRTECTQCGFNCKDSAAAAGHQGKTGHLLKTVSQNPTPLGNGAPLLTSWAPPTDQTTMIKQLTFATNTDNGTYEDTNNLEDVLLNPPKVQPEVTVINRLYSDIPTGPMLTEELDSFEVPLTNLFQELDGLYNDLGLTPETTEPLPPSTIEPHGTDTANFDRSDDVVISRAHYYELLNRAHQTKDNLTQLLVSLEQLKF